MKRDIWIAGFLLAFAVPTIAQQQEFNLKVAAADIDVIGRALGKMPFDEVAALMQKLQMQIQQQRQVQAPAADNAVPVPKPAPLPKE